MDHEIEKEQLTRTQQDRLQQEISTCKESIKQLTKSVKTLKGQLGEVLEDIISGRKTQADLESACAELECLIQGKTLDNHKIDQQTQNLETLIISSQNDLRGKQDELAHLKLEEAQMCSIINFLEEKLTVAVRAKNSSQVQNNEISQQITKAQQKIQNLKRQTSEIQWSCQQIRSQNTQIEDLNRRLITDLEGVKRHLVTMQKMNQTLQNSITEYGLTGSKVTRLINAVKNS